MRADDHVLLIGAAGGYTAAVLAGSPDRSSRSRKRIRWSRIARGALAGDGKSKSSQGPLDAGWRRGRAL